MAFSNFNEQGAFAEAARTICLPHESSVDSPLVSHAEQLEGIKILRDAPQLEHWDKGLLQGLRSASYDIVSQTVKACIHRLDHSSDAEWQDRFMGAILDACFLNLSGRLRRPASLETVTGRLETQRLNQHEQAAAKLFRAVAIHLKKHQLSMEHHRSRILARAIQIKHMEGSGEFAKAVVEFQQTLGKEAARSDNLVADEIDLLRKLESYQSPQTAEPTLLAYLEADRSLSLERVSPELLQAYRLLLNYQAKERTVKAILYSMDNLIHWLDQIPWDVEGREPLHDEVLKNVRLKKPWEELIFPIRRHLEAHLELLPGPNHPEDLLRLLRTKYAAPESDKILIKGLELLQRLPLVRYRFEELCDFILESGKKQRSVEVWYAFLALVEKLLTGLADFVLIDKNVFGRNEQRRNKALEQVLKPDKSLRALLRRLSMEETWLAAEIRERAWRFLLRSLPQERNELYAEGLHWDKGHFFIGTLEEAAHQHQRSLWDLLLTEWDQFVSVEIPTAERQARIKAIADYFQQTRVYEGVQNDGQIIGPMLRLALDEQDLAVRQFAEQTIISSEYALELQRERQKRNILQRSDEFTDNYQQIIKFEQKFSELSNQVSEEQTKRADHALKIQTLLQERDSLVTHGWINTSRLQVELAEVREMLNQTLKEARKQLSILEGLQQRINEELHKSWQAYRKTDKLVSELNRCETERETLEKQLSHAQKSLRQYQSKVNAAERELSTLNNSFPSQLRYIPNDPEEAQKVRQRHDYAVSEHQRRVDTQKDTVNQLHSRIKECENQINSCQKGIEKAENARNRIQQEIPRIQERIHGIEEKIDGLRKKFSWELPTLHALHSRIKQLSQQVRDIEDKYNEERQSTQRRMNQNTTDYRKEQANLNQVNATYLQLHKQVKATTESLDYHKTRSQELRQAIESGRQNYDEVGTQADQQSRQADATGVSLQARQEQKTQENQESSVFYAHGIKKELETQPRPPTRDERPKLKKRSSPLQRTTK